jgi:hypothetical protein
LKRRKKKGKDLHLKQNNSEFNKKSKKDKSKRPKLLPKLRDFVLKKKPKKQNRRE